MGVRIGLLLVGLGLGLLWVPVFATASSGPVEASGPLPLPSSSSSSPHSSSSSDGFGAGALATSQSTDEERAAVRSARLAFEREGVGYFPLKNDRLIQAGRGVPCDEVPVWLMRQAGRYLPEFRAVRAEHRFFQVCEDPKLTALITLQPLKRFTQLDAVIIFSDILVIPKALGQPLAMVPGVGPTFDWRLETPADISKLNLRPDVDAALGYVFDGIFETYRQLQGAVPIIGFAGAPLTLLTYMAQGAGGAGDKWRAAKLFFFNYPHAAHKMLDALADVAIQFLVKQFKAGAHVLQLFDTNAGLFSAVLYESFGVPYILRITREVKRQCPEAVVSVFAKDRPSGAFSDSSVDVVGLGWGEDPAEMRRKFPGKTLQGNLDPQILYAAPAVLETLTKAMVRAGGARLLTQREGRGEAEMTASKRPAAAAGLSFFI
eukprot:GHVT01033166.1.p1 GENE.GHVT01033166.1~~GHVT01033166.1.p1  ORF type:complete len:432 (-),score=100.86 GHVT01033166.1:1020-2315(-)